MCILDTCFTAILVCLQYKHATCTYVYVYIYIYIATVSEAPSLSVIDFSQFMVYGMIFFFLIVCIDSLLCFFSWLIFNSVCRLLVCMYFFWLAFVGHATMPIKLIHETVTLGLLLTGAGGRACAGDRSLHWCCQPFDWTDAIPCGQIHINPCFDALTFRKSSLGSSSKGMGVYQHGLGAAFTTQMKVYHLGRRAFVPAEAILRARLGCCTGISHESWVVVKSS